MADLETQTVNKTSEALHSQALARLVANRGSLAKALNLPTIPQSTMPMDAKSEIGMSTGEVTTVTLRRSIWPTVILTGGILAAVAGVAVVIRRRTRR